MSDDVWRPGRQDDDERFGEPTFADDSPATDVVPVVGEDLSGLSFGSNDTGSLPHWTEPPTGELPSMFTEERDPTDDLDVWSTFTTAQPAWKEDSGGYDRSFDDEPTEDLSSVTARDPEFEVPRRGLFSDDEGYLDPDQSDALVAPPPRRREPTRDLHRHRSRRHRCPPHRRWPHAHRADVGPWRSRRTPRGRAHLDGRVGGRDMPTAIAVGLLIAAAFLGALMWKPLAVVAIVVLITGLAAVEYFDKVSEKGYRPATLVGIATCIAAPLAAYWVGESAIPLVLFLAFAASAATSSAPTASRARRCRTWRSPRSASCGSA